MNDCWISEGCKSIGCPIGSETELIFANLLIFSIVFMVNNFLIF